MKYLTFHLVVCIWRSRENLKIESFKEFFKIVKLAIHFKGAQAWEIRRRVFYTAQACMGRWLRNDKKNLKIFVGRHSDVLLAKISVRVLGTCAKNDFYY